MWRDPRLVVMPPRKRDLDQTQSSTRGPSMAAKMRVPPSEFAAAMSESALEAIVEPITFIPSASAAHMRNWAGAFHSDVSQHDGAFSKREQRVFAPHTIEQVVAIVELARRRSMPVRAVGRLHSPSDLPFSLGWTIRMDELQGVVSMDAGPMQVCALGGTYLHTMTSAMAKHDPPLGFHNLGSISEQTIAGLISTASHGSGIHFPVMSACVESLWLVCPLDTGAQVVSCSRTERPELFNATLCGLGATGVIVSVTLSVEKAFRLKQVTEEAPIDALLGPPADLSTSLSPDMLAMQSPESFRANPGMLGVLLAAGVPLPRCATYATPPLSVGPQQVYPFVAQGDVPVRPLWGAEDVQARVEQLVHSAEHVRFLWSPHAQMVTIDRASRTDAPAEPTRWMTAAYTSLTNHAIQLLLYASRFRAAWPGPVARWAYTLTHPRAPRTPRDPSAAPGGLVPLSTQSAVHVHVDEAPAIFNFDCLFPQYTSEYAIPYEYTGAALVALRTWLDLEHAQDQGVRTHFPIEVRFVDADGIWLSNCYGRRTCYIGLVQYRPFGCPVRYRQLFARFEALMRQFDGRPHWAKTHSHYRAELLHRYPHMHQWLDVVRAYDPQRLLVNPYVARHMLDEHASGRQSAFRRSKL